MKNRILGILTVGMLAMGLGWTLAAQQPAGDKKPAWKDQAEYDIYDAASKSTDAKGRVPLLDKWTQGYATSDYGDVRENMYLLTYLQLNDCRNATKYADKIRTTRPNDFQSVSTILRCVRTFNPPPAADLANAEKVAHYLLDNEATVFAKANQGAVADPAWATLRKETVAIAHQTLAWVPVQEKNDGKAEKEITAYLGFDGTDSTFSYYLSTAILNQIKAKTEPADRAPISYFHAARAAAYDGPNSMPAASRKQVLDYVTQAYTKYHGSAEGLPELLALAKNNVFPPPGFTIKDINVINQEKADAQAKEDAGKPDITMWRDQIRTPLLSPEGAMIWDSNFKDALLPGGANGVTSFKGKIISMTPTEKPKQLVVAVFDPNVADSTLNFAEALPGTMPIGEFINFSGTAKSYTKEPFMMTFDVDPKDVTGWTGTNPKGGTATKGGTKGGAKGPAASPKGKGK